jgi:hypothetical protein
MKSTISRIKRDRGSIVLVLMALIIMSSVGAGCGAGEDWVLNPANEHYYLVVECGEWSDCEKQAATKGAHLVSVDDQAEQDWLIETVGEEELFWIGLNDEVEEGKWEWASGEPVAFTNWGPGEPNNKWECGEDYVFFSWRSPGQWNDMGPCSPEWTTVTRAIIEKTEPGGPSYWWIVVVILVLSFGATLAVLVLLRKRPRAS